MAAAPPPAMAPAAPAAAPPAAAADNRPWYDPGRILGVTPDAQTKPEQFGGENLAPPPPPPGQVAANQPPPDLSVLRRGSVYRIKLDLMTGRFEQVKPD